MDISKQPLTYREAYAKATDLCSRSEKCTFDLELKCREWQLSVEESSKLITSLVKEKFIDHRAILHHDARFHFHVSLIGPSLRPP